jgi:ribonuclease HI
LATVHIDAAASTNPLRAAGAAVFNVEGQTLEYTTPFGQLDNHEAEWAALLFAVKKAKVLEIQSLIVYTDSQVISDSFERNYVKNQKFRTYFDQIKAETKQFHLFLVGYVPRKMNRNADVLAKEALFSQKKE